MIRVKLIVLALALVLSVALMARAGSTTNAYFSDTRPGTMTGTLGDWSPPYHCEPGTSTAEHWPGNAGDHTHVLPIASRDADGHLQLDFGDVVPGNSNNSPDVFRITSDFPDSISLTFATEGAVLPLISDITLRRAKKGKPNAFILGPGTTRSVAIKLDIPGDAAPGEYRGYVLVSLLGETTPICRIPTLITVKTPPPSQGAQTEPVVEPQSSPATDPPPDTPFPDATTAPGDGPSPEPSPSATATILDITPGDAESQRLVGDPPAWATFAAADRAANGTPRVDLGDLVAGGAGQFSDLLRLTSRSTAAVRLTLACDGGLLDVVEAIDLDGSQTIELGPGETTRLSITTRVPTDATLGSLAGSITVASSIDERTWSIPVTMRIVAGPTPTPSDMEMAAAD